MLKYVVPNMLRCFQSFQPSVEVLAQDLLLKKTEHH